MDGRSTSSLVCQTFFDVIMMMMRDAYRVSEVGCENFEEQCARFLKMRRCAKCCDMQEDCSYLRICGTDGLVDPSSPGGGRRGPTCVRSRVELCRFHSAMF